MRDEGAALTMAEGWAMATQQVGVASCTQGPGLTRMFTSLITATRSRTPIVVFTSKTSFNNRHAPQLLDQDKVVAATGAGYIEVLTPGFAENAVREAFYHARLESRPIVLCLPHDIQGKECDSDGDEYEPSSAMFAGQQRIRPDIERRKVAVDIIAASRKPVVLLGRGAMEPQATEAIDRLATRIGAMIGTSLMAQGTLSECQYHGGISGLFSTRTVMELYQEADCVIAFGAGLNTRTLEGGYLYPNAKFIHVDIKPHVMMGNDRGADCYLQGDAAVTAREIDDLLAKQGVSKQGYRTAEVRKVLKDAFRDPAEFDIEPGTMDPREAFRLIDERLPLEVGMVMGVGHSFTFAGMLLRKPRKYTYVNSFGCIGQALPAAIGVGVALGGKPLVHLEGDGGVMQTIQELDTAARLGLKLLFIILNDAAYGAEYHKLKSMGRDSSLSQVRSPEFAAVARAFGCRGRMAATIDDVGAGIDEFLAGEGPMVLDVRLSRNAVSIPYRRLHYGEDV